MLFLSVMHNYLLWHYTRAYFELFNVWRNLLWFIGHFFSIVPLLKSWFSPWKRITEERKKTWSLEDWAGRVVINLISRIIGAFMRTIVICTGLISILITMIGGIFIYAIWLITPILIVVLFIIGIVYLFV